LSNNASSTSAKKPDEELADIPELFDCRSTYARTHVLFNKITGEVLEMNCKSWRCNRHRQKWLYKWRIVVTRELVVNPVNKLITLTLAEDCFPEKLNLARQLFCREVRANYENFDYLSILEFTSRTRLPHLHLLARASFLPQRFVSETWQKATSAASIKPSPVVWIEAPHTQEAAAQYALSYALDGHSKHQDIPDHWRGRKISYSRQFFRYASVREHWLAWIREKFGETEEESANWTVIPY
jgi:hypothetical protein